jgi:hypothetical protein
LKLSSSKAALPDAEREFADAQVEVDEQQVEIDRAYNAVLKVVVDDHQWPNAPTPGPRRSRAS